MEFAALYLFINHNQTLKSSKKNHHKFSSKFPMEFAAPVSINHNQTLQSSKKLVLNQAKKSSQVQ